MRQIVLLALLLPIVSGGCISTVGKIVTAPVRVVSKGVDWTTTSQSESDRNYGKKKRQEEAREGKERRAWEKACRQERRDCGRYDGYRANDGD